MGGKLVLVKKWDASFDFHTNMLKEVPLWVKLHDLPLNCWGVDSLSRIGCLVGIRVCVDTCTTEERRINYASLLIRADATKELVTMVQVEGVNGVVLTQQVTDDWCLAFCKKCNKLGYECNNESKMVQKWVLVVKPIHPVHDNPITHQET